MNQNKSYSIKTGSIAFLLAIFVPSVVVTLWSAISTALGISQLVYYYIALALTQLSLIGIFIICNKLGKNNIKESSKIKFNLNISQIVLIATCGLIALFSFSPLVNMLEGVLQVAGYPIGQSFNLQLTNPIIFIIAIIVVGILPAICEELIFRGIILNSFNKYNKVVAVVLSSLLFMIMHMSIEQTIYQFVLGLILGFVVIKTGSLLASITLHAVNNIVILFTNFMYNINGVDTSITAYNFTAWNIIYPILVALAGVGLMIFILKILGLVTKNKEKNKEILQNNDNLEQKQDFETQNNENDKEINNNNIPPIPDTFWLITSFAVGVLMWVFSFVTTILG